MKKILALLLAGSIIAGTMVGCSTDGAETPTQSDAPIEQAASATEPGTFPISNEKISITIMSPISPLHSAPFGELQIFKDYEEMTNMHVEWDLVSSEAYIERYKLVLASNELPDAFGSMGWGGGNGYESSVVLEYGQDGAIIPLEGLIEEVGVNTKNILAERDDVRKLITYPDGHIYALPYIDENQNIQVGDIVQVNQTFLDALGMEQPKTLEELYDFLVAATAADLNGDGKNETGLSFITVQEDVSKITYLFGLFGVSWDLETYMNQTMDGQGPLEFAPTMDGTREALEYFHEWYAQGLIDPEVFTQNAQQIKAKAETTGVAAAIDFWENNLNNGNRESNHYINLPMPQNEAGDAVWRQNGALVEMGQNQFMITSQNPYPAETLRWVDYWLDNGTNAFTVRFGQEDVSWSYLDTMDENGVQNWTEIPTLEDGTIITAEMNSLDCTLGTGVPYWCFADTWSAKVLTAPQALDRMESLFAEDSYMDNMTTGLPNLVYLEENQEALAIKTDLFKYINSSIATFLIDGVTDESWNEYVERVDALQSGRWVELYNKYYEIYNQ